MSGAPVDRVLQGVVRVHLDPARTASHLVLGALIWAINLQVQYDLDPHADRLDDRRDHELAANAN